MSEEKRRPTDKERLNAIVVNMWFVEPQYQDGTWRVGKADLNGRAAHKRKTLRGAIDAAIADEARGKS